MHSAKGWQTNGPPLPANATDKPLVDDELDELFEPLSHARLIALAVSGGADSLALLDSIDRWRRRAGTRPIVVVLTVDHGLRASSGEEADAVAAVARSRGMAVEVLKWTGPHPKADLEAAARTARYRLLTGACRGVGASHLVTAHHRDDVAETFLMRLARGSGVFGLAAMRSLVKSAALTVVRPLLAIPRDRLVATTAAAGLTPVIDAMNSDPRFLRARVRRFMPQLDAEGLKPDVFAEAAARLADAADAIDAAASALIADAVACDDHAVAHVEAAPLAAAPSEVRLRMLVRVLKAIGGEDHPPRFRRLSGLADAMLARAGRATFKRTLAGTVVEWRRGRFVLYREAGRNGLPEMPIPPGFAGTWDRRFAVAIPKGAPEGLSVAALGEEGRRELGAIVADVPPAALAAVPAIRRGRRILAVPSLGYAAKGSPTLKAEVRSLLGERLAEPPLFPDFSTGG